MLRQILPTILIAAVLAGIVFAIILSLIRKKKQGKSSCGCGCSSCPMQCSCHKSE